MRVAVCMKCVPPLSPPRSLEEGTGRIVRGSLILNGPADLNALEEALRLRDAMVDVGVVEVVVVTVGDLRAGAVLRDAFALGVDRCVLACDDALAGSDLLATSRVLAATLEYVGPELVLFGQEAGDSNGALIWAAVAERLRMPVTSRASGIDLVPSGHLTIRREAEHGVQVLESPLPCVVSIAASANQPRHAALRDVIAARSKKCEVVSLVDLGVEPHLVGRSGSGTRVRRVERAQPERAGEIVEDGATGAAVMVRMLAGEGIL